MTIQVTLQDYTGTTRRRANVSVITSVGKLISPITSVMQLPVTDAGGQEIVYSLTHNGTHLRDDETLEKQGVRENDVITITPMVPKAGGDIEALRASISAGMPGSLPTAMSKMIVSVGIPGSLPERIPLDTTAPVEQLIPAITARLRLPVVDAQARSIRYRLRYNSRLLRENETLEALGFTDRELLVLESQQPTTSIGDFENLGIARSMIVEATSPPFLISYHYADFSWADWIATQLQENGINAVRLFDCDQRADDNVAKKMNDAVEIAVVAERIIAVVSQKYLKSRFAQTQLDIIAQRDPSGQQKLLLPVYIEDCNGALSGE